MNKARLLTGLIFVFFMSMKVVGAQEWIKYISARRDRINTSHAREINHRLH